MDKAQRWLWLVLVSTIQLIVLLVTVLALFSWQAKTTGRVFDQKACLENHEIGQQLIEMVDLENIRDIRSKAQNTDLQKLKTAISNVKIPRNQMVAFFDFADGKVIQSFGVASSWDLDTLVKSPLFSINGDEKTTTIHEALDHEHRQTSGWQSQDGEKVLVSARFVPKLNAILVVGQSPDSVAQGMGGLIQKSRAYAYTIVMLVGLIGISLTGMIVSRVGITVTNLNDGLEKVMNSSMNELVKTKNAVIFGLAKLAESRDNDTGEHLERIRLYVTILAKEIALSRDDFDDRFIHDLGLASSLHDIGKVGIPDSILLKPGKLTPEERGIMELHTLIGGECLDAIQARLGDNEFMSIARQIAFYHHERWDGTGYPHSLKGPEIPLVARIVAVADVYDALTSKRPYKRAMSHLESREIIVSGSGKHFDPEIVEAFLRHEEEFEQISLHQQSLSDEQATSNFVRLCEAARNETGVKPASLLISSKS